MALAHIGFGDIRINGGYDRSCAARSSDRVLTFEATALLPT